MSDGNQPPSMPPRNDDDGDPKNRTPRPRNYTGFALVILIVVIVWMVINNHLTDPTPMKFPQFVEHLVKGEVSDVQVERNTILVELDEPQSARAKKRHRVVVPEAFITEMANDLEEIADIGRVARKAPDSGTGPEAMLAFLARKAAAGEDVDFAVYRRYLVKVDDQDSMLVRMSSPATTGMNGEAGGPDDVKNTGRNVAFLFRPGTVTDQDGKQYELTFNRLLELTNTAGANAERGLPAPGEVTKNLVASKGLLEFKKDPGLWQTLILSLAPWLLIIAFLWFFIFRQMRNNGVGGNVLSFGRSRARIANREKSTVTFADVAGIEEAKGEVHEIVEFLKHPGRFSRLGGRIPRGVLLVGSPGTGKTLLAKAIAGEAEVPFYSICGSDFVEMFVGVGASRVRDLFKQARENSPCIIFLDEIDAVGRRRGAGLGGGHDEREQTLNAILVEMDGFETDTGIIVIAATNRADVLDPALLRPGRFDREISVDLPDVKGREAILRVHARKVKMHPSVDLSHIARGTPGFSGAELEALVNEAAILATLQKKDYVFEEDLDEGRDRIRWGRAKTSRILDAYEQKVTAYHEAGHTLAAMLLPNADPLHKVTIIPRGSALGATMYLPEKDQYSLTRGKAETYLKVCFGGRIAEELFFDDISSGASNDIKQATSIARRMVREWGMSEAVGPICYEEHDENVFLGREIGRQNRQSEQVAAVIDTEVKRTIDAAYSSCRELLDANRDKLATLADALLEHEVLSRDELEGLLAGESVEEVRARVADDKKRMEEAARRESPTPRPETPPVSDPEPKLPPGLAGEGA